MHFEITRALKPGKTLTPAQRGSSLFAEEPRVGGKTLRRGSPPLKLSFGQLKPVVDQVARLFNAGSIDITVVGGGPDKKRRTSLNEFRDGYAKDHMRYPKEFPLSVPQMMHQALLAAANAHPTINELEQQIEDGTAGPPLEPNGRKEGEPKPTVEEVMDVLNTSKVGLPPETPPAPPTDTVPAKPTVELSANEVKVTMPDGVVVETTEEALAASEKPVMETLQEMAKDAVATASPDASEATKSLVEAINDGKVDTTALLPSETTTPPVQESQEAATVADTTQPTTDSKSRSRRTK